MNGGVLLFLNFAVYSWLLLIPIIAIEAWELRRHLTVNAGRAAAVSALANLASTLLATAVVLAIGWLLGLLDVVAIPGAGEGDVSVLIALLPCYFLSVWCETLVAAPLLKGISRADIRAAFFQVNLLSYSVLAIVPVARFVKSAFVNGRIIW
ncbi:MAG: hypothetical protein EXR29_03975 [Betaproteobacteria bacterium]|nr:hypothetical protein [Betaproteobacteria bacterium]